MNATELISSFVKERLSGNISCLADFPLGNLRNDKTYGCPERNFDSDDTELMRVIYCNIFEFCILYRRDETRTVEASCRNSEQIKRVCFVLCVWRGALVWTEIIIINKNYCSVWVC